jgi:hypothetical protein
MRKLEQTLRALSLEYYHLQASVEPQGRNNSNSNTATAATIKKQTKTATNKQTHTHTHTHTQAKRVKKHKKHINKAGQLALHVRHSFKVRVPAGVV